MKKIDIDQLKKENIYSTPENFFQEMQSNVLSKINENKHPKNIEKGKIIPMFWKYAVAAAVILFFGIGLFTFNNNPSQNKETIAKTDDIALVLPEIAEAKENITPSIKKEETISNKIDNPIGSHQLKISEKKLQQIKPQNSKTTTQDIASPMDEVLEIYSSSELAMLTQQVQQDVYLDLFNE